MGREIRRVPPNWEHPLRDASDPESFEPMYDQPYAEAADEWLEAVRKWEDGEDLDREIALTKHGHRYYWDWNGGPPDKDTYRPEFTENPTWFQLYETVTEGTPVSPPFETEQELIDWLCVAGDFWCQKWAREGRADRDPIPTCAQAAALIKGGYAPSMSIVDGKIMGPAETAEHFAQEEGSCPSS